MAYPELTLITGKGNYVPGPVLLFNFRCVALLYVQNAMQHFAGRFPCASCLFLKTLSNDSLT